MSDGVSIEWPREDVRALWRQVDRAQKELGKTLGQAVRFAAWSVASSFAAITKIAPKYRDYVAVQEGRGVASRKGGKKYEITSHRKGIKKKFFVRASSVAELKKDNRVRIGNRGIARMTWYWTVGQIGGGRKPSKKGATRSAERNAQELIYVTSRLRATTDPFVKIVNRLNYVRSAMIGGESAQNAVMGKASRQMEKIIDYNIAKKMGAK